MAGIDLALVSVIAEAVRLLNAGQAAEARELLAAVVDTVSLSDRSLAAPVPTTSR